VSRDPEEGDRVVAQEALGGIIFATVPKGTKGVVSDVRGWFSPSYTVHFDNDETVDCSGSEICRLNSYFDLKKS
jgi:hypothetical protein